MKNEVVLEQVWISDAFKFCETEFYNLVTTVTSDDDSRKFYAVPIGRCNKLKKLKSLNMRRNLRVH